MKAAVCHEHGKPLTIEQVSIGDPSGHQVKVKIGACAICHSDIHYAEGAWGGYTPAIYGHEASGVVMEAGSDVDRVAVGDKVIVTLIRSCVSCHFCDQGEPVLCDKSAAEDETHLLALEDGTEISQGMKTAAFAEWVLVDDSQIVKIPDHILSLTPKNSSFRPLDLSRSFGIQTKNLDQLLLAERKHWWKKGFI